MKTPLGNMFRISKLGMIEDGTNELYMSYKGMIYKKRAHSQEMWVVGYADPELFEKAKAHPDFNRDTLPDA